MHNSVHLSTAYQATVRSTFGAAGATWLANLPALLADYAARWQLHVGAPFDLSYNYVAPAVRADGTPAVLKLGPPGIGLEAEYAALTLYDGRGAVRVLAADLPNEALLLERVQPGTQLAALTDDDAATRQIGDVMQQLWRPLPPDHGFVPLATWAAGLGRLRQTFDGGCGPFPEPLVTLAERLFGDLLGSADETVLLHGDLHHFNILAAGRTPWLAIDPKGIAGERAAEPAAMLYNPAARVLAAPDPRRLLARRLAILAEQLPCDAQRVRAYAVALTVLSAWWDYEDGLGGIDRWLAIAESLAALR